MGISVFSLKEKKLIKIPLGKQHLGITVFSLKEKKLNKILF